MSKIEALVGNKSNGNAAGANKGQIGVVIAFPVVALLAVIIGYSFADQVSQGGFMTNWLLGAIMLGMGLTVKPADFALVIKQPLPVLLSVLAQYAIMPMSALVVVWILGLPPEIGVGVILLGCVPSGTTSNVITYLSRGDVALSVTLTSVSTFLAPLLTPILTMWIAGQYMPLDGWGMAKTIMLVVLVPVAAGVAIRAIAPSLVRRIEPVLPWITIAVIGLVVAIVVAGSADRLIEASLLILAAVILHNFLGMALGYVVSILMKQPTARRRAITVEVGNQNTVLAAGLAAQYMNPIAAIPGVVFTVWQLVSGAIFATLCRLRDNSQTQKNQKDPQLTN